MKIFRVTPDLFKNIQQYRALHTKTQLLLRGLLEKYPTFGREKETGLLGALDT